MSDKATYIQSIFTSIAGRYDFVNSLLSLNIDKSWRKFAVKVSELEPDDEVLDVCTGTGELALAYRNALGATGRVTGLDFCEPMLEVGRQKIKKLQIQGIEMVRGDAMALPYDDCRFDVTSSGFGLRNVTDLKITLREMMRVTKSGGRVVIFEFTIPPNRLFRTIYFFFFRRILPPIGRLISRDQTKAYSYLPDSVMKFPNAEQLKLLMEENGLKNVQFYLKTFGVVAVHVGRKP